MGLNILEILITNDPTEVFDENYDFLLYSLGFESQYQATYPQITNCGKLMGSDTFSNHLLAFTNSISNSPVFESFISNERNELFLFSKPSANFLIDYRNLDQINELFLTRSSFDNYFQTRKRFLRLKEYYGVTLVIADFYHKYENRNINDSLYQEKNALWLEFKINPAPWLKFEIASRLKSQSFNLS